MRDNQRAISVEDQIPTVPAGGRQSLCEATPDATDPTIVESIPQIVWSANGSGIPDYFNRHWHEFTGLSPEQSLRSNLFELIHPHDRISALMRWHRSRKMGEPWQVHLRLRHRSGRYVDMLCCARPERNGSGEIARWYGTCVDLRPNAEVTPIGNAKESRFREMLDSLPQMIWTNTADGTQNYYNRNWYEFTGTAAQSAGRVRRAELIHPDDLHRALARWNRCIANGEPYECRYRLRHASGEYRWVLSRGVRDRASDGELCWFGTTTDVHDHVLAIEALNESEALNQSIIGSSADSIVVLNLQGRIVFANEAALPDFPEENALNLVGVCWAKSFHHSCEPKCARP